jgi:hypothetical protein
MVAAVMVRPSPVPTFQHNVEVAPVNSVKKNPLMQPASNSKAHPHLLRHVCGYALANKGTLTGTERT